jgi:hypothetical protein
MEVIIFCMHVIFKRTTLFCYSFCLWASFFYYKVTLSQYDLGKRVEADANIPQSLR